MKKVIFIFALMFPTLFAGAQTAMTVAQQRQTIAEIDRAAAAIRTLRCHFAQTKELSLMKNSIKSEGTMYFSKPDKLRWQYSSPYDYTFIMNNGRAYMKSVKATTTVDMNRNKIFREISDVIMNCMIGGNLSGTSYFKVSLYKSGDVVYANLLPLKKEIKQLYSLITLRFNPSLTMVNKVEMTERNGDKTIIVLSDIKRNESINDKVFSVD